MTPVHHPEPDELFAYASGTSPEWISLVIACHLTYCPLCRRELQLMEELGGALLESLPPDKGLSRELPLDELVSRELAAPKPEPPPRMRAEGIPALPRPLEPYFKDSALRWRFLVPGVKHIPLALSVNGIATRIVRFKPGFTVPDHTHEGLELVLVLSGALSDSETGELFRSGDLSRREEGTVHAQHVTPDEPCICLVSSAGPVRPESVWGRILKKMAGV